MAKVKKTIRQGARKIPKRIANDQMRDAVRLALQSGLAASLTFLIMNILSMPERFLAVLSTVLVLEPSIGDTINHGKSRILSTAVGCLIGFVFISFIPYGTATAIGLFVTAFIMSFVVGFKSEWSYGLVGAVAIAMGSESDVLATTIERLMAIAVGIVVGLIISALIWPDSARKRTKKYLRKALSQACNRFELALQNTMQEDKEGANKIADNFYTNLGNAKETASAIKWGNSKSLKELIKATEKLYNSILIVHRVGVKAPSNLLSEGVEIEDKSKEIQETACGIITNLINNEKIEQKSLEEFSELIEDSKRQVIRLQEGEEVMIYRHSFIFGMIEIRESLQTLKSKW